MFQKLCKRFFDTKGFHTNEDNLKWIKFHCSPFEKMAKELDPILWEEAEKVSAQLEKSAYRVLREIEYDLGGGGVYPFLYFLTRYIQPKTVVETGVAAGFSSYAFLSAIRANGQGKLYSSDFPYFRLPNPEKYIGIVVEESLKEKWHLYTAGDKANIPKILSQVDTIDLFHYDSDKTYSGRAYALSKINDRMHKNGMILMDDIQDNSFFYDFVERNKILNWKIFEFEGKYIGIVGVPVKGNP